MVQADGRRGHPLLRLRRPGLSRSGRRLRCGYCLVRPCLSRHCRLVGGLLHSRRRRAGRRQAHAGIIAPHVRVRSAGQHVRRLLPDNDRAIFGHEPHQEADLGLQAAGPVPGKPHAVGVTQRRLAVMVLELFLGQHILAVGRHVARVAVGLFEGVDDQLAFDLDRLAVFLGIKHQPAAEAASGRAVGLAQHGVGPHRYDLDRPLELAVFAGAPGNAFAKIEMRTTAAGQQYQSEREEAAGRFADHKNASLR